MLKTMMFDSEPDTPSNGVSLRNSIDARGAMQQGNSESLTAPQEARLRLLEKTVGSLSSHMQNMEKAIEDISQSVSAPSSKSGFGRQN